MDLGTTSLSILGMNTSRSIEYNFVLNNISNSPIEILDAGSAGSPLPLRLVRRGHYVTAADIRGYHGRHRNLKILKVDLTNTKLPPLSYDTITCISTLEHIGLGAYGDPLDSDGDMSAMMEFFRILRPHGRLLITFPFSGNYKIKRWKKTAERVYDYNRIESIFRNWKIIEEEYYIPISRRNWKESTRREAMITHEAYPDSNIACFALEKDV